MRIVSLVVALGAALALAACGGGNNARHQVNYSVAQGEFLDSQPASLAEEAAYDQRLDEFHNTVDRNPNAIVVSTSARKLCHQGLCFKVGVGREGFQWSGTSHISDKKLNPDWRPPREMIERVYREQGKVLPAMVPGGDPINPLGCCALYINGTLYRIHGTDAPRLVGQAASSGCIRMRNEDVTELYRNVSIGTKVIVLE